MTGLSGMGYFAKSPSENSSSSFLSILILFFMYDNYHALYDSGKPATIS